MMRAAFSSSATRAIHELGDVAAGHFAVRALGQVVLQVDGLDCDLAAAPLAVLARAAGLAAAPPRGALTAGPPVCDGRRMLRTGAVLRLKLLLLVWCGTAPACGASPPHLLSPQIAKQVGAHYGDPQPVVVSATSDRTESDGEPMYLMTVAGQLRKDGIQANTIRFSALATRLYVWDIRGFDRAGQQVWSELEWGGAQVPAGPHRPLGKAESGASGQPDRRAGWRGSCYSPGRRALLRT